MSIDTAAILWTIAVAFRRVDWNIIQLRNYVISFQIKY